MAMLTVNLPLPDIEIIETKETADTITVYVRTTESSVPCKGCGNLTSCFHGHDSERRVEHTSVMGKHLVILYRPRRYICKRCNTDGITTTATPNWHDVKSMFTNDFEERLMVALINSTVLDVAKKHEVSEKQVQGIVDCHVSSEVDWDSFTSLGVLGLDDIALKKGYNDYISIITSRIDGENRIVAIIKGRKKKDIKAFFKSIPARLKKTVIAICIDMYIGYVNAAREVFNEEVAIIVDRYHVAKLYRAATDKFRQEILKELKRDLSEKEYEKIKNVTHILRRGNECLSKDEKQKLKVVFSHSHKLSEVYRLALSLTHIFNTHQTPEEALDKFSAWIQDVRQTKLKCFNKFISTFKKFRNEICNYFIDRLTSGFVEGLNNKIKVLKRRCYGIFNLEHMFQRLHLDMSGYNIYSINIGVL